MKIIEYDEKYRDDLIFMILEAKDAIAKIPNLTPDLLEIEKHYINNGGKFWIAVDDADRVIGSCGYLPVNNDEARLKRLYVKSSLKRQGIGSKMLHFAEEYLKSVGKKEVGIHLGEKRYYFESYGFYAKRGYESSSDRCMYKKLL